jgi:hypothetical protein
MGSLERSIRRRRKRARTSPALTVSQINSLTWGRIEHLDIDPRGEQQLLGALAHQRQSFIEKFGREPEPNDPVFFDVDSDVSQQLSVEEVRSEMITAMKKAGIPGELIYAYEKTGMILSQDNLYRFSPE